MPIKVYISGICGSHDVRKQQQRVLFILSTLPLDLEVIDVTDPGKEEDLTFMQEEAKKHNKKIFLPPQIFHDNDYCGDYDDFQLAADDDVLMNFLKLEDVVTNGHSPVKQNGVEQKAEDVRDVSNTFLENTGEDVRENIITEPEEIVVAKEEINESVQKESVENNKESEEGSEEEESD